MNDGKSFQFLSESNFQYLCKGLTLDNSDMEVIDQLLVKLNDQNNLINSIVTQNHHEGLESTLETSGPQIIVSFDKYDVSGKPLTTAVVMKSRDNNNLPPALHINLRSPTLNIPQRIEIPLRYVLKGAAPLQGTYMVYLHATILRYLNRNTGFISKQIGCIIIHIITFKCCNFL